MKSFMKTNRKLLLLLGISVLGLSMHQTANAALAIKISDGTTTSTIVDNQTAGTIVDSIPTITGLESVSTNFAGWVLTLNTSSTLSGTAATPSLDFSSFSVTAPNTGTGSQSLTIWVTDTDLGATTPNIFDRSFSAANLPGSVSFSSYYDPSNVEFSEATPLGTTQIFTPTSANGAETGIAAGSVGTLLSPYSLTLKAVITSPTSPTTLYTTQFTSNLAAVTAVPLPAAAWLLGSGLLGLIGFAHRNVSA